MSGIILPSMLNFQTLSGGTRVEAKTARPWQLKLIFPEKKDCPFCSRPQTDEYAIESGWKTFQNSNTPFPFHRLLIPTECWQENKLRSLGGAETIEIALRLAMEEITRTGKAARPMWIYTHIGYGAGQNLTHNHWHLCEAPTQPEKLTISHSAKVELFESVNFTTFLAGVRAGQSFIQPKSLSVGSGFQNPIKDLQTTGLLHEFAGEAHRLVYRFNEKFKEPDYCLLFAFNGGTQWHARFTPILNNWGGSEFAALDYGTPFILPWPHQSTRDLLLSD